MVLYKLHSDKLNSFNFCFLFYPCTSAIPQLNGLQSTKYREKNSKLTWTCCGAKEAENSREPCGNNQFKNLKNVLIPEKTAQITTAQLNIHPKTIVLQPKPK